MSKQISTHAAAAKQIRQHLKKNGIKARVRSKTYTGGDSVDVTVFDQMPAAFKEINSFANQYEEGSFNGMIDLYEYDNVRDDIPQVKYIFVTNEFSDEMKQKAYDRIKTGYRGMENAPDTYEEGRNFFNHHFSEYASVLAYRILTGFYDSDFWSEFKPRVKAAA